MSHPAGTAGESACRPLSSLSSSAQQVDQLLAHIQHLQNELRCEREQRKEAETELHRLREQMANYDQAVHLMLQRSEEKHMEAMLRLEANIRESHHDERKDILKNHAALLRTLYTDFSQAQQAQSDVLTHTLHMNLAPVRHLAEYWYADGVTNRLFQEERVAREWLSMYAELYERLLLQCAASEQKGRLILLDARERQLIRYVVEGETCVRDGVTAFEANQWSQLQGNFFDFLYLLAPRQTFVVPEDPLRDVHYVGGGVVFHVQAHQTVLLREFQCTADQGGETQDSLEHVCINVYWKEGTFVGFESDPAAWTHSYCASDLLLHKAESFTLPAGPILLCAGMQYALLIRVRCRKVLVYTRRVIKQDDGLKDSDGHQSVVPAYRVDATAFTDGVLDITGCRWCSRSNEFCELAPLDTDVFCGALHYHILSSKEAKLPK